MTTNATTVAERPATGAREADTAYARLVRLYNEYQRLEASNNEDIENFSDEDCQRRAEVMMQIITTPAEEVRAMHVKTTLLRDWVIGSSIWTDGRDLLMIASLDADLERLKKTGG